MGATQTLHCPELADTPALVSNLLEQIDQLIFTQKLDQPWLLASTLEVSGLQR